MTVILRLTASIVFVLGAAGGALASTPIEETLQASLGSASDAPYYASGSSLAVQQSVVATVSAGEAATNEASTGACTDCEELLDCMCCGPLWYASAGFVILHRDRPNPGTSVAANPAGTRFASPSDFEFGWDLGLDVTLARRLASGDILEARFFMDDSAEATHNFVTPGNFIGGGFTGPGGTTFSGSYDTNLYSLELNLRRQVSDQLKLIAGARWLDLKDILSYKLNGNVATGQYNFNNRLYGGQLGADWALTDLSNPLQINVVGKAGVYANDVDGGIFEFQGNNFIGSFVGNKTGVAFVVDFGLSAAYLLTDQIAIRSGYQLLWLGDVALAGDAAVRSLLNPSLLRTVDDDGHLLYQGATVALDIIW